MSRETTGRVTEAAELRREFDQAFAVPTRHETRDLVKLLAVRAGGEPYALRLTELSGLVRDRRVMPVPSSAPEMRGVAGLRGALVPVYDLGALLGHGVGEHPPIWLALVGKGREIALAFEKLEGHIEIARSDLSPADGLREGARVVVRTPDATRVVIDIPVLLERIKRRLRASESRKER